MMRTIGSPFRWRWGKMARMCLATGSAPGASSAPRGFSGRTPLIFMLGALILRDLSRENSLIRQFAGKLLKLHAAPRRTVVEVHPASPPILSQDESRRKNLLSSQER